MHIHWIANCTVPPPKSMSGGDRIMVECLRRWSKEHQITVYGWEGTRELCDYQNLRGVEHVLWSAERFRSKGLPILFNAQTWIGCRYAKKLVFPKGQDHVLVSSSDFLPDTLPAWTIKKNHPQIPWIASFYLFSPGWLDFLSGKPGPGFLFTAYHPIQQWVLRRLIRSTALLLVTGEEDRQRMISMGRSKESVFAVRGGVDLSIPQSVPESVEKKYDAVFIGRFHPQKGVRELVKIWKLVCQKKPEARLVMIGVGPLESELRSMRDQLHLNHAIEFAGFLDGVEKYKIIKASRVVVHPAIYDSGGMAAAEALVCGLPGVAFDLPALQTYYPKGFLKAVPNDFSDFARNIVSLLENTDLYKQIQIQAKAAGMEWDWNHRAQEVLNAIQKTLPAPLPS